MLPKWEDRNEIIANMFNPAFCGEIMRVCFYGYIKEKNKNFPFALLFLILPIILQEEIRLKLPDRISANLYKWTIENKDLLLYFYEKILSMQPYSKESIIFLINYKKVMLSDFSTIILIDKNVKTMNDNEYFEKAFFLGKWFSKYDASQIYRFFEIKP
jgi:hypothetical protein